MIRIIVKKPYTLKISDSPINLQIGVGLADASVYIEREEGNTVAMGQTDNAGVIEFDDINPGDMVMLRVRKADLYMNDLYMNEFYMNEFYLPFERYGKLYSETIINMKSNRL